MFGVCSANIFEERENRIRKNLATLKENEWHVEFPGEKLKNRS